MIFNKEDLVKRLNDGVSIADIADEYKLGILTIGYYLTKFEIPHAGIDRISMRGCTPIYCSKDDEEYIFSSIKETARFLSICDSGVTYNIDRKKKVNGYELKKLDRQKFARDIVFDVIIPKNANRKTKDKVILSFSDIKKMKIEKWNEELEASFRRLDYYH